MGHCKHSTCCQCGAKRGTPEHDAECPDAIARRMISARSTGHASRRLSKALPDSKGGK